MNEIHRPSMSGSLTMPARPASRRLVAGLFTLAAALLFVVSGGMLWELGLNYNGITGAMASKIHPATYVTVATLLLFVAAHRNPAAFLPKLVCEHRGAFLLLVAAGAVFVFVVLGHRPGPAGLIDTFMLPAALALMMGDLDERSMRRLESILHLLLACNAVLTLFEFVSGIRFFPYRFDGELLIDTRPEGLLNHPLENATAIGCYIAILLAGGGSLRGALRWPMICLQWAALIASGGRTASVLMTLFIAATILRRGFAVCCGARLNRFAWIAAAVGVGLIGAGIAALEFVGFFDALAQRFADDGGSAQARVQMFEIFSYLPMREILLGPDVELVDSVRRAQGLELGIENPLVRFILYQGAVATFVMVAGLTLFLRELMGRLRRGYMLPLVFFLLVIMSFESLSSKSIMLAQFTILMGVMFRRPANAAARRFAPAMSLAPLRAIAPASSPAAARPVL